MKHIGVTDILHWIDFLDDNNYHRNVEYCKKFLAKHGYKEVCTRLNTLNNITITAVAAASFVQGAMVATARLKGYKPKDKKPERITCELSLIDNTHMSTVANIDLSTSEIMLVQSILEWIAVNSDIDFQLKEAKKPEVIERRD